LHERRVQVGTHGEAADHGIGEHRDEHAHRGSDEARAPRSDAERADHHQHRRNRDGAADQPVDLFDGGVRARHVDERLRIAVRPVVAAQPAAGQTHDPAGYNQQAETAGGEGGDQPELAHAQGPAIHVPSRI
jgi:hypothetical protein